MFRLLNAIDSILFQLKDERTDFRHYRSSDSRIDLLWPVHHNTGQTPIELVGVERYLARGETRRINMSRSSSSV